MDGALLFIAPDERRVGAEGNPNETQYLQLFDHRSRLIYCPAHLVDPSSRTPGRNCLVDAEMLSPGPGAFVGFGRTQASVILNGSGAALCPGSLHVMGSLTSPAGDVFDLDSRLVLAEEQSSCAIVGEEMTLDYAGPPGGRGPMQGRSRTDLSELADMEDEWAVIDELVRLDDQTWELLGRLLALPPGELDRLDSYLEEDGLAGISDDGRVYRAGSGPLELNGTEANRTVTRATINDVFGIVTTLKNRIPFALPNKPGVRNLVGQIGVASVGDLLGVVKQLVGGIMNMVNELRDGFEEWEGNGCGPATGCGLFKDDLEGVMDQVLEAWDSIQSMACLVKPDLETRPLPGIGLNEDNSRQLIRRLVVEKAPNVVIYGFQKMLSLVDGWETMVADMMAGFPSSLSGLCTGVGAPALEPDPCPVLRNDEVALWLIGNRSRVRLMRTVMELTNAYTTDDVAATAAAVAVGGGGGGTNIKNPGDMYLKMLELLLNKVESSIEFALSGREACFAADAEIERDLGAQPSCVVLAEYTFAAADGGRYDEVDELVRRRKNEMQGAGVDIGDAQAFLQIAGNNPGTRTGFDALCSAYNELGGGGGGPIASRRSLSEFDE